MKGKGFKILHILFLLFITIMIIGACYLKLNFSLINFEEVVFSLKDGTKDADVGVVFVAIKVCLPFIIVLYLILYSLFYSTKILIKIIQSHKKIVTCLLFLIGLVMIMWSLNVFEYILYSTSKSNFIEKNYVEPVESKVTFDEKRNLIFIVVESLETSLFQKEQGGYWNYSVVPELYDLLNDEDSVVFYDKSKAETLNMIQGSSWTTASIVSNSSGLPFKVSLSDFNSNSCMNGAYTLGDLLKDNGYYNEVISAAKTSFGDLQEYFTDHGEYEIIDFKSLKDYDLSMTDDDIGSWGFNDNYLFETAKKRLDIISKKNQPFNLELITIDTHFVDGFVGNYSETKYKDQYENAYATESRLIYNFVDWVKKQPYYKNTTIVIMGDHLSMQSNFFRKRNVQDRYVYSCIINPVKKQANTKNRITTSLDTYPTIVSSIGGTIEDDKLGLGVNLFSDKNTLAEEYGIDKLNKELKKKSVFYNNKFKNNN